MAKIFRVPRSPGARRIGYAAAGMLILALFWLLELTAAGGVRILPREAADAPASSRRFPVYAAVLDEMMPEPVCHDSRLIWSALASGRAATVSDVEALPMIRAYPDWHWYPHYQSTAVIAVDRDRTDRVIRGWQDLMAGSESVGLLGDAELAAAVASGLDPAADTLQPAYTYFRQLKRTGRLRTASAAASAAVMICFDDDAVQWRRRGRHLELVVPAEGTLTFTRGLIAPQPLPDLPGFREILLAAGFRLPDGRSEAAGYPAADAYVRARPVRDPEGFQNRVRFFFRNWRRQVEQIRLLASADPLERMLFPMLIVLGIVVWLALNGKNVMRTRLRRIFQTVVLLCVSWIVLRYLKYQVLYSLWVSDAIKHLYLPIQMALCACMLWVVWSSAQPEASARAPRWLRLSTGVYAAASALALTTRLHGLAYQFDPIRGAEVYGPGFNGFILLGVAGVFAALCLLIRQTWSLSRRRMVAPLVWAVLLLGYILGYRLQIPIFKESDYSNTICLLILLFMEIAIRNGLLSVNHRYRSVFRTSTLDMQILDHDGRPFFRSQVAEPLDDAALRQLTASPDRMLSPDESTRLFAAPLAGGQIVWKANISAVVEMKKTIQMQMQQLERANQLLAREWREQSAREAERERRRLLVMLESEIQTDVGVLRDMIGAYPDAPDRRLAIGRIALLLCYIKRRCNFFFRRAESRQMQMDELYVYLRELESYAQYLGADILIDCPMTLAVDIGQASLFYRFFYSMLIYMCETGKAHALGDWAVAAEELRCRIMLDRDAARDRPYSDPALMAAIRAQGGVWLVRELDEDTVGYQIIFEHRLPGERLPGRGVPDGPAPGSAEPGGQEAADA